MLNVLLISPRLPANHKSYSGEHAYTDTLLRYPPPGVRYLHYEDLLATGEVRKIPLLYRIGPRCQKLRLLPPDLWAEYLSVSLRPDLIHIHGFSAVVQLSRDVQSAPIVLSTSTGSIYDLKFYLGWEDERIRRGRWTKRQFLKLIGAHDSSLRPEAASRVLVWSEFARQLHLDEGWVRPNQIDVLYPGLPGRGDSNRSFTRKPEVTFLFIGRDFVRKNGQLVLDAFRRVRADHPDVKLIFVSTLPDGYKITEPGVEHHESLRRQELLERIYPQADVLVLPSRAEGFGLVLLEAMSFGMPVIGMNAWAMPEVVEHEKTGFLIEANRAQLAQLVDSMLACTNPAVFGALQRNTRQVFERRFSVETHNKRLFSFYQDALINA